MTNESAITPPPLPPKSSPRKEDDGQNSSDVVLPENARSVSHRDLPPLPSSSSSGSGGGSILLFYQYIEPQWTPTEHKTALKKVIDLGRTYNITGRGRVAQEGLNCTLTGQPLDIRNFCYGLRKWKDVFNETDFKITDGIPVGKMFKSLSIRKTNELVAYGLEGGEFVKGRESDSNF